MDIGAVALQGHLDFVAILMPDSFHSEQLTAADGSVSFLKPQLRSQQSVTADRSVYNLRASLLWALVLAVAEL